MEMILICDVALGDRDAQNIHVIELFNNLGKVTAVRLFSPKPKKLKYISQNINYIPRLPLPIVGIISYQIFLFFNLYFYCKRTKN